VGIDACRKVEEARCRRAKECGLPLATPPAVGDEVEACIRFYKDACLRGLTSKTDPGEPGVLACVDAVRTRECAVVQRPETTPACAFLQPATPDAGPGILDAQPNGSPDGGSDAATTGTGQDASLDGSAVGFGLDAG
jgi:hypothetical protein